MGKVLTMVKLTEEGIALLKKLMAKGMKEEKAVDLISKSLPEYVKINKEAKVAERLDKARKATKATDVAEEGRKLVGSKKQLAESLGSVDELTRDADPKLLSMWREAKERGDEQLVHEIDSVMDGLRSPGKKVYEERLVDFMNDFRERLGKPTLPKEVVEAERKGELAKAIREGIDELKKPDATENLRMIAPDRPGKTPDPTRMVKKSDYNPKDLRYFDRYMSGEFQFAPKMEADDLDVFRRLEEASGRSAKEGTMTDSKKRKLLKELGLTDETITKLDD